MVWKGRSEFLFELGAFRTCDHSAYRPHPVYLLPSESGFPISSIWSCASSLSLSDTRAPWSVYCIRWVLNRFLSHPSFGMLELFQVLYTGITVYAPSVALESGAASFCPPWEFPHAVFNCSDWVVRKHQHPPTRHCWHGIYCPGNINFSILFIFSPNLVSANKSCMGYCNKNGLAHNKIM
jgi:hypothetical protein